MEYSDRLQNVSVLGAGGKMGSGIVLLLALEMDALSRKPENKEKSFLLSAIDVSQEQLRGLRSYIRGQVRRMAEKKIVQLRDHYIDRNDLSENGEIIDQYIEDVLQIIETSTSVQAASGSLLVFEAVNENPDLKVKLFNEIETITEKKAWYFTNTSSIPIHSLEREGNLEGRITGYHFYNPPAVQKLVELIPSDKTLKELTEFSLQLAGNLRKTIVVSHDIAGFIGNGHFMRELLYSVHELVKLQTDHSFPVALWMINKITQDFMVRPMGIFQLIDYVGLDVCSYILQVMALYMDESLHSDLLDELISFEINGGQFADGSQKDGFFQYSKNSIRGIYNLHNHTYDPVEEIEKIGKELLGPLPDNHKPWKAVLQVPDKKTLFDAYFTALKGMNTMGSGLALAYGLNSKNIGLQLVREGVASTNDDVNTVMVTGFYHAYGPINDYYN